MSSTQSEKVLVVPAVICNFEGFVKMADAPKELVSFVSPSEKDNSPTFIDREKAEVSPQWKQLLPYIAIISGDNIFTYRRSSSSGEAGLRGQRSIGIGGHINESDDRDSSFWAMVNGARREIGEELGIEIGQTDYVHSIAGFVNDNSGAVGQVHVGLCSVNCKRSG